ncbi:sugar transferase [Methylobacterium sp. 174MFSha1.1]|uniref:sugar transferase n=1 Tax=Methylobacterium sp. 174MFSha1.1 TaxID=1502749 RepID=UPI001AECBE57|nr:sugar transferase [Methylobacterium sp. 174MFSha1.1]
MGRLPRIIVDVALAVLATLAAIFLRTDLDIQWPDLAASAPYLCVTAASATIVIGLSGLDLGFWRFASLVDIVKVIGVALVTTICTVAIVFAYNRLEGVARAIPVMQPVLITMILLGPRLVARAHFIMRRRNPRPVAAPVMRRPAESVLILGLNSMTEVFLRALLEAGEDQVSVAGIVCIRPRHVGRFLRQYRVLGTQDDLARLVADLAVHGVDIRRIVLTVPLSALTEHARTTLIRLEAEQGIRIDQLSARLAGTRPERPPPASPAPDGRSSAQTDPFRALAVLGPADLERLAQAPYWRRKRIVDVVVTVCAALALAPLGGLVLVLVTIDLGWPPIFWQNRLGLGGAGFRLYKFRTMAPAHDSRGLRIPEDERLSGIGRVLRRSRLDELPQLWNVLIGDMALTGPRPLLAIDQPAEGRDRLVVRPGLTGWAQVKGGRTISPAEKTALDLWWIRTASFTLDLHILAGTVRMVLTGESVNRRALAEALAVFDGQGVAAPLPSSPRPRP